MAVTVLLSYTTYMHMLKTESHAMYSSTSHVVVIGYSRDQHTYMYYVDIVLLWAET